jgi:hypothetical protein
MTIEKFYKVEGENSVRVTYMIKVSSGDKDNNIVLYDFIDHIINIGDDLSKVLQFEKEAEKREKELREKAVKLADIVKQLKSMGYESDVDDGD